MSTTTSQRNSKTTSQRNSRRTSQDEHNEHFPITSAMNTYIARTNAMNVPITILRNSSQNERRTRRKTSATNTSPPLPLHHVTIHHKNKHNEHVLRIIATNTSSPPLHHVRTMMPPQRSITT